MERSRNALAVLMIAFSVGLLGIGFVGNDVSAKPVAVRRPRPVRPPRAAPRQTVSAVKHIGTHPRPAEIAVERAPAAATAWPMWTLRVDPSATMFRLLDGSARTVAVGRWQVLAAALDGDDPTLLLGRCVTPSREPSYSAGQELALRLNEFNDGLNDPTLNLIAACAEVPCVQSGDWLAETVAGWQATLERPSQAARAMLSQAVRQGAQWAMRFDRSAAESRRVASAGRPSIVRPWLTSLATLALRMLGPYELGWLRSGVSTMLLPPDDLRQALGQPTRWMTGL